MLVKGGCEGSSGGVIQMIRINYGTHTNLNAIYSKRWVSNELCLTIQADKRMSKWIKKDNYNANASAKSKELKFPTKKIEFQIKLITFDHNQSSLNLVK